MTKKSTNEKDKRYPKSKVRQTGNDSQINRKTKTKKVKAIFLSAATVPFSLDILVSVLYLKQLSAQVSCFRIVQVPLTLSLLAGTFVVCKQFGPRCRSGQTNYWA